MKRNIGIAGLFFLVLCGHATFAQRAQNVLDFRLNFKDSTYVIVELFQAIPDQEYKAVTEGFLGALILDRGCYAGTGRDLGIRSQIALEIPPRELAKILHKDGREVLKPDQVRKAWREVLAHFLLEVRKMFSPGARLRQLPSERGMFADLRIFQIITEREVVIIEQVP